MPVAFALLHSPLVGPSTWALVADELRRREHHAITPALDGEDRGPAPYWRRHATAFARPLRDLPAASVVLIAHSGAGPLLPAVADALGPPIGAYLFVDAGLPRDGASRLELLAAEMPPAATQLRELLDAGERYPTWRDEDLRASIPDPELRQRVLAEVRPQPADFWTETIPGFPGWPDAPCGYLRLSSGYDKPAAQAQRNRWPTRSLEADHFHMLVDVAAVTDALLDICADLGLADILSPGT